MIWYSKFTICYTKIHDFSTQYSKFKIWDLLHTFHEFLHNMHDLCYAKYFCLKCFHLNKLRSLGRADGRLIKQMTIHEY